MTEWWAVVAPRLHAYLGAITAVGFFVCLICIPMGMDAQDERLRKFGIFGLPFCFFLGILSCLCA